MSKHDYVWNYCPLSREDLITEENLEKHNSLKYQLQNPERLNMDEMLKYISLGLGLIMDEIEEMKDKNEQPY